MKLAPVIALLLFGCGGVPSAHCPDVGARPLLYVDESGCIACSRHFSRFCAAYVDDPDVDLFLRTSGAQIDIAPFMGRRTGRIHWDDDGRVAACLGLPSSAAVFFRANGEVDTIVVIGARTLESDLHCITSRLRARRHH